MEGMKRGSKNNKQKTTYLKIFDKVNNISEVFEKCFN